MSIILEKVGKSYDGKPVISEFSYIFPEKGRYCILGPSGCGKTTLMRMIAGLEEADDGRITGNEKMKIGFQFQEDRLLPWFSVRKNLNMTMNAEQIRKGLRKVGMEDAERKYPSELSGGMKRRVSLVRALFSPSDTVLLDEPVREVDTENARKMLELIDAETAGKLLIMVSHDIAHANCLGCQIIDIGKKDNRNER